MELNRIHKKLKLISFIILATAALLAAILILASVPQLQQSPLGKMFLPAAVIIGFIIAGLAMYQYYSSRYKFKSILEGEKGLSSFLFEWERPGFIEPQELLQSDFERLEKILFCKMGVLYVEESEKYIPVASFGLNMSEIRSFVLGHGPGFRESIFTGFEKLPPQLTNTIGWDAGELYRFNSPVGTNAIAVFSEMKAPRGERIHEELFLILVNRISLELDYIVARFRYRLLRKKLRESFNDNINLKKDLKRKVYDINSLFKESSNLYTILNEGKLFNSFLLMIMGQLALGKAVVFCRDRDTGDFLAKYGRGIPREDLKSLILKSNGRFIENLHSMNRPTTVVELRRVIGNDDELIAMKDAGFEACCKIVASGSAYGYLLTGGKLSCQPYRQTDLKLLSILVNIAASALENINNYRIIEELSFTDSMTGLYNYRYFYKRLNEEIFRAKRYFRDLALIIFDIDDFKNYNDIYGHQAGDAVLRQLGAFLQKQVRAIDVVCRYGGEEFCIIMQDADANEIRTFVERLRKSIESHKFESEFLRQSQKITVSIGAAIYPNDADTPDKIIYCADMAMLKAKSGGKNISRMFCDLRLPKDVDLKKAGTDE